MKLDVFNHLFPKKYYERMLEVAPCGKDMHKRVREVPCLVDLDERFRIMDQFGEDYAQVITLPSPAIEAFGPPRPFRMFYADAALFGAREATRCGLSFFGADRVLFASDAPFDPEKGSMYIRTTIEIIDRFDISPEERYAIYEGNARRLLKLN